MMTESAFSLSKNDNTCTIYHIAAVLLLQRLKFLRNLGRDCVQRLLLSQNLGKDMYWAFSQNMKRR